MGFTFHFLTKLIQANNFFSVWINFLSYFHDFSVFYKNVF